MQYFSKGGMIQLKFPAHIGDRIELTHLSSATHRTLSENNYNSQLLDFDEVDMVKLSMPIFENRIIPLEVGDEYQLCFYTENGLYQCRARVENRYKEKNMHMMDMRLLSQIRKFQRRNFYRLDCEMDIKYRTLEAEEQKVLQQLADKWPSSKELEEGIVEPLDPMEFVWNEGVVADLSGGGVRFRCKNEIKKGMVIEIIVHLAFQNESMPVHFLLRVISCERAEIDRNTYEIRGMFEYLNEREREIIVQYVFEEQRRRIRKE